MDERVGSSSSSTEIEIRQLSSFQDLRDMTSLHEEIWSLEEGGGFYTPLVVSISKFGGILLGAYRGSEMIGFSFGFPGIHVDGRLKLHSQTTGIHADYRGQGIGRTLKQRQFTIAKTQGYELITWTFDPLQPANAWFNFGILGAISNRYETDYYDQGFIHFDQNLPSDRFLMEYWLDWGNRPESAAFGESLDVTFDKIPLANPRGTISADPSAPNLTLQDRFVGVQIPADIQALAHSDPMVALEWRLSTREIFTNYFERGYTAIKFIRAYGDFKGGLYLLRGD